MTELDELIRMADKGAIHSRPDLARDELTTLRAQVTAAELALAQARERVVREALLKVENWLDENTFVDLGWKEAAHVRGDLRDILSILYSDAASASAPQGDEGGKGGEG